MGMLSNWLARLTVNQVLRSWGFESLLAHKNDDMNDRSLGDESPITNCCIDCEFTELCYDLCIYSS